MPFSFRKQKQANKNKQKPHQTIISPGQTSNLKQKHLPPQLTPPSPHASSSPQETPHSPPHQSPISPPPPHTPPSPAPQHTYPPYSETTLTQPLRHTRGVE